MQNVGTLFIISGSSGVGKTTVTKHVCSLLSSYQIKQVITYTTREPRGHEKNGQDYYFVSLEEFRRKQREDFFLELTEAYGHAYGTPKSIMHDLNLGLSFIIVVDRLGLSRLQRIIPHSVSIWLFTENNNVLERRLQNRKTHSQEQIRRRMDLARQEALAELESPLCMYHVRNNELLKTVKKVADILEKTIKNKIL